MDNPATKIKSNLLFSHQTQAVAIAPDLAIGAEQIVLIAGPCSVESYEQTRSVAEQLHQYGVRVLRGGAFKPRKSPHSFNGLGEEGLKILRSVADEFDLLVITEALSVENIALVAEYSDIIQIGSRNMHHFPLLWAAGETDKPILLKRGFMATVEEWLFAADHIEQRGNSKIILCERGIRSFDSSTRNLLDTNAIALAKQTSRYPVIADPSHATGRADLVLPAALAAIGAGADGLLVEFHPDPSSALSDGAQSLPLESLPEFIQKVSKVAEAVERGFV